MVYKNKEFFLMSNSRLLHFGEIIKKYSAKIYFIFCKPFLS